MNNSTLEDISVPIKEELGQFNELFKKNLKSNVALVDLVTRYILRQKGKKIRPLLVFLSGKTAGEINERTYRGATLVEMLHTATLIHDDVVDNADQRRGLPSINAIWKNKIAVLMGDFLLSRGLMIAVDGKDFDFLGIITGAVKRMSEGELLQISKTKKLNIDEQTYFKIISDKTASLLSTCCEIGALSTCDDIEKHIAMRDFGENIGMAFQIRDDILDYIGKTSILGKPLGADIKDKKITLPLIYALKNSDKNCAGDIIKLIKKGSKKNVEEVIEFVKSKKGIEYATDAAREFSNKAKDNLKIFPDSPSKQALEALVDFITDRKN